MKAKVNKTEGLRRMNALLQLAVIRSGSRLKLASVHIITEGLANYYMESEEGQEVGVECAERFVRLSESNETILAKLATCIEDARGTAEQAYRRQVRSAARAAMTERPQDGRQILSGMISLVQNW